MAGETAAQDLRYQAEAGRGWEGEESGLVAGPMVTVVMAEAAGCGRDVESALETATDAETAEMVMADHSDRPLVTAVDPTQSATWR
jgi:hypothetical protein